jgi:hypothetical protein
MPPYRRNTVQRVFWFFWILLRPPLLFGTLLFTTGFIYALLFHRRSAKGSRAVLIAGVLGLAAWLGFIAVAASGEMP